MLPLPLHLWRSVSPHNCNYGKKSKKRKRVWRPNVSKQDKAMIVRYFHEFNNEWAQLDDDFVCACITHNIAISALSWVHIGYKTLRLHKYRSMNTLLETICSRFDPKCILSEEGKFTTVRFPSMFTQDAFMQWLHPEHVCYEDHIKHVLVKYFPQLPKVLILHKICSFLAFTFKT
jgi:hypothetical protein